MTKKEATLLILLIVVGLMLLIMNHRLEIPMGGGTVFNLGNVLGLIVFATAIFILVRIRKQQTHSAADNM